MNESGPGGVRIRVELVRAWPRRHEARTVELPAGATVADALVACGIDPLEIAGLAVFGERVQPGRVLVDGERVEVLRALEMDPKEARRRRALAALQERGR